VRGNIFGILKANVIKDHSHIALMGTYGRAFYEETDLNPD